MINQNYSAVYSAMFHLRLNAVANFEVIPLVNIKESLDHFVAEEACESDPVKVMVSGINHLIYLYHNNAVAITNLQMIGKAADECIRLIDNLPLLTKDTESRKTSAMSSLSKAAKEMVETRDELAEVLTLPSDEAPITQVKPVLIDDITLGFSDKESRLEYEAYIPDHIDVTFMEGIGVPYPYQLKFRTPAKLAEATKYLTPKRFMVNNQPAVLYPAKTECQSRTVTLSKFPELEASNKFSFKNRVERDAIVELAKEHNLTFTSRSVHDGDTRRYLIEFKRARDAALIASLIRVS